MIPAVKVSFDRLDRLNNAVDLFVPCEHNKGRICSGAIRLVNGLAARGKYLVISLTYFSVKRVNDNMILSCE
jgi:hypothetical protein